MLHQELGKDILHVLEEKRKEEPQLAIQIRCAIEEKKRQEAKGQRFAPREPGLWSRLRFRPWLGSTDVALQILFEQRKIHCYGGLGRSKRRYTIA